MVSRDKNCLGKDGSREEGGGGSLEIRIFLAKIKGGGLLTEEFPGHRLGLFKGVYLVV